MNTINPVRPYVTIKNNPQTPSTQPTQPQAPAFKGVIGDKIVKQIAAKEAVTVASIVALAAGMIGLNKDKVSDMVESFVNRIKGLQTENESLTQQLKQEKTRAAQEKEAAMREFAEDKQRMQDGITHALVEKNLEIKEKDAKIAELQKYEAMARVKSVDEDLVMPEQIHVLFEEIEANNKIAHESLFNYVMTGKGQEEFLAQMGRNNQLVKAREDGMDKIPEVEEAFNNAGMKGLPVGRPTFITAYNMLEHVLVGIKNGEYIQSPVVEQRVKDNAKALFGPLGRKGDLHIGFSDSDVDKAVENAKKFQQDLRAALETESYHRQGFEKVSETYDGISPKKSYWTFKDKNGNYQDFSLYDISREWWGTGRVKNVNGKIIHNNSSFLK